MAAPASDCGATVKGAAPERQSQGSDDEDCANPRCCPEAERRFDHQTTDSCADGNTEMESRYIQGRCNVNGSRANLLCRMHDIDLQTRDVCE